MTREGLDNAREGREKERWAVWALAVLLVWSFALRAWTAGFNLTAERFWDERYGFQNVEALLAGSPRPANGFHPGLSYLPQAALLAASEGLFQATGIEALRVRRGNGLFTPTAYLLARLLQALFGTLSLLLTYRIGRRLFSSPHGAPGRDPGPAVGLGAALLLSVVPWHIRQSVIFKPDILLVMTTLLAFWWSLDAAERPAARSYLKAGAGIGLALASKFNAGPIALPLAAVALIRGRRDRRLRRWLLLAGAAAVLVFLLLDPYTVLDPEIYRRSFGHTLEDYARKGALAQATHLGVFLAGFRSLLGPAFLGPWVGALALAGLAGLALAVLRGDGPDAAGRTGRAMLLVYVLGYALLYSLSTTNPSPHNWLMVTPFLCLAAAWLALVLWQGAAARLPERARRPAGAAAAGLAALLLAVPAAASTYRTEVSPTTRAAQLHLREHLRPYSLRVVCTEPLGRRLLVKSGREKAAVWVAERFDLQPAGLLDRCDAEVFPAARLEGEERAFYASRLERAGAGRTVRIAPRFLRLQGPELMVVHHPWEEAGPPERLPLGPGRTATLPAGLRPDEIVSLEVLLPPGSTVPPSRLDLGGVPLPLLSSNRRAGRERLVTPRVPAAPGAEVALAGPASPAAARRTRLFLRRWRPGPP